LKVSIDYRKDWDNSKFDEVVTYKNESTSSYLKMINKPIGLESLGIGNNNISIKVNARILNENYGKGFCLDTVEQLRDTLKRYGIELNQDFIKESTLSLVHIKNDVQLDIEDLLNDFTMINPNKHFKLTRDNNITFESINKHDRMSLNIYGKYCEMNNNKSKYKGLDIDINSFKDTSRVESKLNDYRTVKKYLGTRNMMDILNQTNINSIILNNILKGQPMETPQLDLSQFKTISQLNDLALTKLLYDQFNGNYDLMKQELKKRLGKNTKATYQTNKIKNLLPLVQSPGGRKLNSIIELKEILKE
tara:strand:- start:4341 stop:5255 length:915 start_codon:yes stop_codon:yes gene_type:complete